jgi:hypothetical protein
MSPSDNTTTRANADDGLNQALFDLDPRWRARASARRAEYLVDMQIRANDKLHRILGILWHSIGSRASRSRVSPLAPESRLP